MMNLYRPIYDRLEVEVIELSNFILFSDKHLNVTSIKIAELLLRTVSEIENVAKAIEKKLLINKDEANKSKNLKLHKYLDIIENIGGINSKVVQISNHNFHFTNQNLIPFKVLSIPETKEQRYWHYAYNKLKHDRDEYFEEANLGNLVTALGALFLLNIYLSYPDHWIESYNSTKEIEEFVRCGSKVFSLEYVHIFILEDFVKSYIMESDFAVNEFDFDEKKMSKIDDTLRAFKQKEKIRISVFKTHPNYSGKKLLGFHPRIEGKIKEEEYVNEYEAYFDEAQILYFKEYYEKNDPYKNDPRFKM